MSTPTGHFAYIHEPAHLASSLGVGVAELYAVRDLITSGLGYDYRDTHIHGKLRRLAVPIERVKSLQSRINDILWPLSLELHPCSHGYVPDRSTRTNAEPHCGAGWVQRLDIRDFYPSTRRSTVAAALSAWGFIPSIADLISYLIIDKGSLPLGAPCSPLISNLVLSPVDAAIADSASSKGVTYTRYADDLTFSANMKFDMTKEVATTLRPLGYELNLRKSRLRRRGQSISVTGLRVAEVDYPRLPKPFKRRLRQEFYYIEKFGLEQHCLSSYQWGWIDEEDDERHVEHSRRHLQGKVHYSLGVEPKWMTSLLTRYPIAGALFGPPADSAQQRRNALIALVSDIRARPHVEVTRTARLIG